MEISELSKQNPWWANSNAIENDQKILGLKNRVLQGSLLYLTRLIG